MIGRDELHECRNTMLHVVCVVIVAQLSVVPEPHDQIVWILDLVGGGDAGADRRKGVEGLAHPAGARRRQVWRPSSRAETSIIAGVAEDGARQSFAFTILAGPLITSQAPPRA